MKGPERCVVGTSQWGRYSELSPFEIEAIRERTPVAFIPWGALEWHSRHAPIGLDSVKAEGICVELAKRRGGIVLPAIPMGVNTIKPYKGFPHSIDIPSDLAARVAETFCRELADEGFRLVILFTGHYPPEQIEALQEGADRAAGKTSGTRFVVWSDNLFLGDAFQADHAGATETSFQMHFGPGTVDFGRLPDRVVSLDEDGITGEDPRVASEERGARQLEQVLAHAIPELDRLFAETGLFS